jgi:hypothetical protein
MSFDNSPLRCTEPETVKWAVAFTGAGAANPTKNYGKGVAVTWVSTGKYRLTFVDAPGNLVSPGGPSFQDATPGNLKGYTAVFGTFDTTGKIVDVSFYNSSFNLTDLTSTNVASFVMLFKKAQSTL